MNAVQKTRLQTAEKLVKIVLEEVGPEGLAIALNNVSWHGKTITDAGYDLDTKDVLLGEWFEGIEKLMEAGKRINKFTNGKLFIE